MHRYEFGRDGHRFRATSQEWGSSWWRRTAESFDRRNDEKMFRCLKVGIWDLSWVSEVILRSSSSQNDLQGTLRAARSWKHSVVNESRAPLSKGSAQTIELPHVVYLLFIGSKLDMESSLHGDLLPDYPLCATTHPFRTAEGCPEIK